MTEATPEAPAQEPTGEQQSAEPTDWQAEATRLREELTKARKWEERAKENSAAAKAAEKARLDAMSESERVIEEAKQAARREATTEFGQELAITQFDALAGRRNADFDTTKVLRRLNLASLLDEDGRPDAQAIQEAVEDLVPTVTNASPSLDLGRRSSPTSEPSNPRERIAEGLAQYMK